MILWHSLLCRNVAEHPTLLFVVASHVYKDDAGSFCVTAESAFFRNLLDAQLVAGALKEPIGHARNVVAHLPFEGFPRGIFPILRRHQLRLCQ